MKTILSHNNTSLAEQPVNKLFWHYTLPSVMAMLVNGLYSTIDGIFIGQIVGQQGLAAINLVWPISGFIIGIGLMIGVGASAQHSIFRGKGHDGKAKQMVGNALIILCISSLLLSIIIFISSSSILSLIKAQGSLYAIAASYLHYVGIGTFAALAGAALPMIVRNDERPYLATGIIASGAIINIVLDYIIIARLRQGVPGAAIATIVAQLFTVLWCIVYLFSKKTKLRLKIKDLGFNFYYCQKILKTGLPSLMMSMYLSFVLVVHNRLFLTYGSTVSVAAFAIVGYIQVIYYMVSEGIANGMQPIVSFNMGAKNQKNMHTALQLGVLTVLISGIVIVVLIDLWPDKVASLFIMSNVDLLAETVRGLKLHLATMYLEGFIVVVAAYFQALGNYKTAVCITMGSILLQIPLLMTLPKWLGLNGVWLALPISNVFLTILALVFIWQNVRNSL
ncbi:MAG: MATE family efflux transporter [Endozoicomonas sp. (ex Botrylloides leachii)]|nr:MATE family efflux transporter [Endozoicomonas sp. (ex Botrylloides leachii)]